MSTVSVLILSEFGEKKKTPNLKNIGKIPFLCPFFAVGQRDFFSSFYMKTKAEASKTKILQHEDVWLKENERFVVPGARLRNPVSTPPR